MKSNKLNAIQVVDNGNLVFDSEQQLQETDLQTQLWFGAGIDLQKRTLEINGDVNESMASFVLRSIIRLNSINHDPIVIYFSSSGGSVYDGFSIYDVLRDSPSPIVMVANGKIASMGIVIFLAGTERMALPNTRFMIHSVSHETGGTVKDTLIDVNEAKTVNDRMFNILAERTKLSRKSLTQNTSHDVWFDVEKAEKWGLLTTKKPIKKKRKSTKR